MLTRVDRMPVTQVWVAGLNAARDREIEKSGVGQARRPERGCCSLCFGSKRAPERDPLVQY